MPEPRIRVAAYAVRSEPVPELLVFDHVGMPEAGTRIPAGGVQPGVDLERAVLRELAEETGVTDAVVVRPVALDRSPHPTTGMPRRTTFFLHRVPASIPSDWTHRVRSDGEDDGLTFACRFEPLPLTVPPADGQHAWLGQADPSWATAAGRTRSEMSPDTRSRPRS
ncbi:NUDIX hydrolase [Streptomyces meridianus]|uniref:NUDIX domain-containing protein n=1 Tax=Streptomyces meridianus TaxID=2938945 RepID=A0ABT0X5U0_9ACTN|nr:NUDIX domain-containing protein [Streptomyces meridianus]MCM2577144.1 NUDIX domain-containing protein [Streptomyces meridianus]